MGIWLREAWWSAGARDTGLLLLHGFSGDPSELLPLAEAAAADDYSVLVPPLPGHGGAPHDLAEADWSDWLARAQAALWELRLRTRQQIVVGFSMGGALALNLARHFPDLSAVVTLATPLFLEPAALLPLVSAAQHVLPWFYPLKSADFSDPAVREKVRAFAPEIDLDDEAVQRYLRRSVRLPVKALVALLHGLRHTSSLLPHIHIPALVLHGLRDSVAPPASATIIAHHLAGPTQLRWLARSPHLLLQGPDAAQAITAVLSFCAAPPVALKLT